MTSKLIAVKAGKRSRGQKYLIAHLEGKRLTYKGAVQAKCYDCMGYYVDGLNDCEIPDCPLYPFSPYRKKESDI